MGSWGPTEWLAFLGGLGVLIGIIGGQIVQIVLAIKGNRTATETKQIATEVKQTADSVKKTAEEIHDTTAEQSKVLDYQTEQTLGPDAVPKSKE